MTETRSKSNSHLHAHRRLRRALDELFVLAGLLGLDGTILEVNRATTERAGLSRADVIGRPIWECSWWSYDTKAQQQVRDAVRRARSGEVVRYDAPVRLARGELITIDFQLAPMRDEEGAIEYLVPSGVDITERKLAEQALRERTQHLERAEEALRKSELQARALAATAEFQLHRLQVALEAVAQGLVIVDSNANPIEVNSSYARMLGFESVAASRLPLGEFEKRLEARLLDGTPVKVEDWPVARALRGEFVRNCELEIRRRDTEESLLIASVNAAPVRDASGEILEVVVTLHDITRRREMELRLREADRRKDEFLAILAHELRNPLAPIRTAAEIMKFPSGSEAQRQWSGRIIDRQVQQMARLLDDLLDISRITHDTLVLRRERVSLGPVIEASIETIQPLIDSKQQTLELESPDTEITMEGDPVRLTQILTNLLENAAKYTPTGGRIRVGTFVEGTELELRVRDSGIGMTKEFLGRVFDMFTQARRAIDRAGGGLGIGLAITRGLVELHGGHIEARSEGLGHGSEFIVHLPLVQPRVEAAHK
jgi:PAS domain S-box-containing protein